MNLETLISPNAVITDQPVKSKKRALETLAVTLAEEAIDSGKAMAKLDGLVRYTTENA